MIPLNAIIFVLAFFGYQILTHGNIGALTFVVGVILFIVVVVLTNYLVQKKADNKQFK